MVVVNNKFWQGCGEKGTLVHCWWECRLVQPLWKIVWNFLRKLKMELPFDLAIPLLGLYPKNPEYSKEHMHPNVHSSTSYNSQVLKAIWMPISKWMDQKTMVHLHDGILCSRKIEGVPMLCDSMDGSGSIMLSEISQVVKDKYNMISPWSGT